MNVRDLAPDYQAMINRGVELYDEARIAGWPLADLEKVIAVSMAESTADRFPWGDLDKVGDPTDDGRTWGPSYGPLHVRTILEASGTGSARDLDRLQQSRIEALRAAREIYEDEGWGAWASTHTPKGGGDPRYVGQLPYARIVADIAKRMENVR